MESYHLVVLTAARYNILPLTSSCNLRCLFCSHRQNPPGVETRYLPPLKPEQVDTLLDFLVGTRKIVIGESATRLIEGEPLTHPDFLEILARVRRRFPATTLEITTNGTLLTRELARALADLGPLEINLSLNSASPAGRLKLMGDKQPETALQAPLTLQQAGITYHGSLVALPWIAGWPDVRETILYLARSGARTIRIFLPGYTRLAPPELRFPANLRQQIEAELEHLRKQTDVPLLLEPPCLNNLTPVVEGVIPGTPASRAGLQKGDIILAVDGQKPRSRVEAYRLINRPGRRHLVVQSRTAAAAPFRNETTGSGPDTSLAGYKEQRRSLALLVEKDGSGLTFSWDFDPDILQEVEQACRHHHARRALIMTSELAGNVIKEAVAGLPWDLEVITAPSRFFGGSIACAGLLTLGDFKIAWQEWRLDHNPVDLIILPAIAFDYRGFDLTGQYYLDLASATGVPVVLV
ncbi:Aldolase-type TIM barrel [Moorella glycerini]|uniref:Cyclic pyranopterin monophosphate synthase n=1 Tax=Neomoorella stamsii TaxID=1266720 RepID=A0A9X7J3C7_9FIRM|nr:MULTISPECIES: radical SAM protein [Moorella]PRR72942.1 Cyclic pyranopterin monophosphate synthase [Moorella stamsii]CEP67613.1 Aldolase-type TIM barrel [Moorella glycerini]